MIQKNAVDIGLLLIRLGFGIMYLNYGFPKLFGGPEKWFQLGQAIGSVGIHFGYTFWGFAASLSEFAGAFCLLFGLCFRPALFFMLMTMVVAVAMHLGKGDGLMGAGHALENGIVFLTLMFLGPGRWTFEFMAKNFFKK